jgi:hypothetical protein
MFLRNVWLPLNYAALKSQKTVAHFLVTAMGASNPIQMQLYCLEFHSRKMYTRSDWNRSERNTKNVAFMIYCHVTVIANWVY